MPFRCSVFICCGNYDKGPKVSVFKFPKDKNLCEIWKHRFLREDFTLTANSRICELHFRKEDIIRDSEFFDEKTGLIHKLPLKFPKLKSDAVPSSIPGVPQYLQPSTSNARMSPESKKMRTETAAINKAVADSLKTEYSYDEARRFSNLKELSMCLRKEELSPFWTLVEKENVLILLNISENCPETLCSVFINSSFKYTAYIKHVPITKIGKFLFPDSIKDVNVLMNLLKEIECFTNCNVNENDDVKNILEVLTSTLLVKLKSSKVCESQMINFILEQITCLNVSKNNLRYSPDLIIFCSIIFNSISPHCYKYLRNI